MKYLIQLKSTYFLISEMLVFLFILGTHSCKGDQQKDIEARDHKNEISVKKIITGANQTEKYLPLLKGKQIAVVANQTSVIFKEDPSKNVHIVDSLLSLGINIIKVFAPEHGFRGKVLGGKHISDINDKKTGLPIKSLYGKSRKPSQSNLQGVDVIIFDIQDVGVRFYTYISTMTNVMEAAAENNIQVIILDRPNPNGHFIDGPVLKPEYKSFVGMHTVPIVYGLTIGEYAQMVNGEKWLKDGVHCNLKVIKLDNYTHNLEYSLPIRPSPNLPNDRSINLYPGLGLFEGTIINEGRGTDFQFQRYGAPFFPKTNFSYIPQSNFAYKHPKFEGELCYGVDLSNKGTLNEIDISSIIDAYNKTPKSKEFFKESFTRLAGNLKLREQIESEMNAQEIRATWQDDIEKFKKIREKYLLYN